MKFLCDVHISFKLVNHLRSLQFETIHVNEILEDGALKNDSVNHFSDGPGCRVGK